MTDATTLRAVLSDAELILAARSGDGDAYGELYIRHLQSARAAAHALTRSKADADDVVAEAFSRVLSVLQRGGGPDVSFRPYLLTTVRNTFYERSRRTRLEDPTDTPDDVVNLSLVDLAASEDDRSIIATAFASLPERWQLVLWHTEVEGRSAAEVAPLLGIAPNAVAALSYRAREGLRQAYLQSHLLTPQTDQCKDCISNLGAYVRDSLPARDRRKVDDHLAGCSTCPALLAELTDANTRLRAVLIPLIIGVPAAKYLAGLSAGKGLVAIVRRLPWPQQAVLGTAAASIATAVVITAASFAGPGDSNRTVTPVEASIVIDQAGSGSETFDPVIVATTRPSRTTDADATSGSDSPFATTDTVTTDPTATDEIFVDSTPSNTLPQYTSDTTDIVVIPDAGPSVPIIPVSPYATVRTTPVTQPRQPVYTVPVVPVTPITSPATTQPPVTQPPVTQPTPTQPTASTAPTTTVAATTPTVPPTQPTTATTTAPTTAPTTTTTAPTTTTTTPPPVLAAPQVGLEVIGRAYTNGRALIRINIANGTTPGGGSSFRSPRRAGPATAMTVTVALPDGVTFASVSDPAWACAVPAGSTALECSVPGLPDGQRASADIRLAIGPDVKNFSIRPSISADGGTPVDASKAVQVQVSTIDDSLYTDFDTGSVLIVGNSSMTCNVKASSTCADAQKGVATVPKVPDTLNRQLQPMIYVDNPTVRDADGRDPFNASSATLALGDATVSRAYLVWGGDTRIERSSAIDPTKQNQVRLTTPDGAFHDVVSTTVETWTDGSIYSAYADVTDLVRSTGTYRVSDIQAAQGVGGLAGWSLVVVTHDPAAPMRLLAVTTPGALIFDQSQAYSTMVPLDDHTGPRPVTVAIASFEGDLAILGDRLQIGEAPNKPNPFDSTVVGAADPVNVNNFGIGSNITTTTLNGNALQISASSTLDQVRLTMIAIAADV
jgi:RNA polymerase sigma factor (sigma-70 family)